MGNYFNYGKPFDFIEIYTYKNKKYKQSEVSQFDWGGNLLKSNEGVYIILDKKTFQFFELL